MIPVQRPFLLARNVHKRYGDHAARYDALRGITLEAAAGEFLAIRGPSGCGKSTLLHVLGAMDRPDEGEIWLNGRRLDRLSLDELAVVRRRHVGFVFQAYNLLPTLTAVENVFLPLTLDGAHEHNAAQSARIALADVGLVNRGHHYPSQLSGGEMQRVAIARALAIQPELLLADEPTGSLDSANGTRVLELLAELNRSRGLTILMATHAAEAAAYADRTILVRDGQIDEEVNPRAISTSVS